MLLGGATGVGVSSSEPWQHDARGEIWVVGGREAGKVEGNVGG